MSTAPAAGATLRPPAEVMRLACLGASFPTRLSFMRRVVRRLHDAAATIERPTWQLDGDGFGRAVYRVDIAGRGLSLACFAHPLDPARRTDRVIAEAWDATFVLYDGSPDAAELDRLAANAPLQEAGRFAASDLVLARANKSVRAFDHVVERLAAGRQPEAAMIRDVGYLMRTTAVYGNGKFGIADRARIAADPLLRAPFQAELLAVYLVREFTHDLAEHVAAARGGARSARLDPRLRRHIGVGNSTGLGMAPFLVNHPVLLNNWVLARETALARVRAIEHATPAERDRFVALLARARAHVDEWRVDDPRQRARVATLARELSALAARATAEWLVPPHPWQRVIEAVSGDSAETRECVAALILEPYPRQVDDLAEHMDASEVPRLDPGMSVAQLAEVAEAVYGWTRDIDFNRPRAQQRFWYVSEEKLEPRLGERNQEPGAERELPLTMARDAGALFAALASADPASSTARLVLAHPELRHIVRRAQTAARWPYAEIRDSLIDGACMPIDMLRCKLAFFGASKFDPRSDRWIRITLYQGAPTRGELGRDDADDWCFPHLEDHA